MSGIEKNSDFRRIFPYFEPIFKPIEHACTRMHTNARKNTAHELVYHGSYSFTQISVNASLSLHSRSIPAKSSTLFPFSAIFLFKIEYFIRPVFLLTKTPGYFYALLPGVMLM